MIQFSVSLYSFYSAIKQGVLSPMDCIAKAKEMGFDAIEAVDFVNFDCPIEQLPQRAEELRKEAEKHGLTFLL